MKADGVVAQLRARYPGPAWAFLESVRNGTGYRRAPRTADALAMSLYPSRGLHLHGFEVKVSRGDWLREVRDPEKADEIARYCHFWWVAAPAGVVQVHELPGTWGAIEVSEKKTKVVREAKFMKAKAPDHLFMAAILRRVCSYATDEARIAVARTEGREEGREAAERAAQALAAGRRERLEQLQESVEAFQAASGVRIDQWSGKEIGQAVVLVMRGGIGGRFKRMLDVARAFCTDGEKAIAEIGETE